MKHGKSSTVGNKKEEGKKATLNADTLVSPCQKFTMADDCNDSIMSISVVMHHHDSSSQSLLVVGFPLHHCSKEATRLICFIEPHVIIQCLLLSLSLSLSLSLHSYWDIHKYFQLPVGVALLFLNKRQARSLPLHIVFH